MDLNGREIGLGKFWGEAGTLVNQDIFRAGIYKRMHRDQDNIVGILSRPVGNIYMLFCFFLIV